MQIETQRKCAKVPIRAFMRRTQFSERMFHYKYVCILSRQNTFSENFIDNDISSIKADTPDYLNDVICICLKFQNINHLKLVDTVFDKVYSNNCPGGDVLMMIVVFYIFLRQSDNIGYVHYKRDQCTVKCKIYSECKVNAKRQKVTLIIDEMKDVIKSVQCNDSPSSENM